MPFNPFDKPLGDALSVDDLQKLVGRQVAEGYYVEYKRELPANLKIGRSVASLANTYGGWYIVGVKTDGHNVATDVCGFDLAACPDPIAKVREVIKTHISPTPVFFAQVVTLAGGQAVLVIYVPEDQDTPFISSDGRIYRRIHDSSDPIAENDRHAVDRLVDRGRESQQAFGRFCVDERTFSEAEGKDNTRWLGIYLMPYPAGVVEFKSEMWSVDAINQLLELSRSPTEYVLEAENIGKHVGTGALPFTIGQLTHRSIILQQVEQSNIGRNSLSMEFYFDGRAKIFLPLEDVQPITQAQGGWQAASWVASTEVRQVLEQYLAHDPNTYGVELLRFFNVEKFWASIAILVNLYRRWLGEQPVLSDFKLALTLKGVWRSAPFMDIDEWAAQVRKIGMPVVRSDRILIPENIGQGLIMANNNWLWLKVVGALGGALGLSTELFVQSLVFTSTLGEDESAPPGE